MEEVVLATARHNDKIDPSLGIWTWEVSFYLFLGGLTAGIMCFAALMVLMRKEEDAPFAANRLALLAPIVLSLGMTTLFLDLEHKLYVFRFYTAFELTSPMSWGAWILVVIYPVSILQILSTLRAGYPVLAAPAEKLPFVTNILDLSERYRREIAMLSIPFAVALGIYTGILLSAFSARPFWNTGVLGPLFLVSGLSTAAALVLLAARRAAEKHLFTRIDLALIGVELMLVVLLLINLGTGSAVQLDSTSLVLGGPYTFAFWVLFVTIGLLIPLVLETWEMRGGRALVFLAPVLVLFGGYVLRHVTVEAGQFSAWTHYETQYDPALLERLQR